MAVDMGTAKGYLEIDISDFVSGMQKARQEADKTANDTEKSFSSKMTSAGKALESAGSTMTKAFTVPIGAAAAAGLKVGSDFEAGMSQVAGVLQITDKTSSEFQRLRDTAIDLGAKTAFSSGEVADAMTEMAKAGWNSSQIIDGMGGVLDAAAASGEGLSTVATICADAVTGFGLEAKDSTRIADLLAHAANAGTIDIKDLGETFKYVAPMALASVGAGADGLIIEVHNDPVHALCDGAQSLKPDSFKALMKKIEMMLPIVGKKF